MADDLRARFDIELQAAGLVVPGGDNDLLLEMWAEHLATREALRAAAVADDEEPQP